MRIYGLALATALVGSAVVSAQQPGPSPDRLDQHLQGWERAMHGVSTLVAQCNRTTVDKTYGKAETFAGTAKYLKPNMADLYLQKFDAQKKPVEGAFERFIIAGDRVYEYSPQTKEVRVHELPPSVNGQLKDDSFLSFLFGMKAEEAKRRYDLRLVKEDQWYVYLEVIPRMASDKVDFQKARLVLTQNSYMPRQLWYEQPTGNEVQWDIPKVEVGVPLGQQHFQPPAPPQGWRTVRVPHPAPAARNNDMPPPRVVRPQQ